MREPVDAARLRQVMAALGRAAEQHVRVYLVGGTTAVAYGWRDATIDLAPALYRFPAIDPPSFRAAVDAAFPEPPRSEGS